jgi:hypothetical protein
MAERALRLANSATIADTVGWIHHLLDNDAAASPLIERAVEALPGNVDVLLHAATVRAALGDIGRAREALQAALKINPAVANRAEIKALADRVGGAD